MITGAPEDWLVKVTEKSTKESRYVALKGLYGGPLAAAEVAISYVLEDSMDITKDMSKFRANVLGNGVIIADLEKEPDE